MTPLAVAFMTIALVFVTGLAAWCYYKVLVNHRKRGGD